MATLFGMFPFLKTLFADSGYQGPKFAKALAKVLPHLDIEIVKRSDQVSGFVVLPKRGSSSAPLLGSTAAAACPKIGSASTERPWRSCASPQSASCSENYAIRPEVSGRTLRPMTFLQHTTVQGKPNAQTNKTACRAFPLCRFSRPSISGGRKPPEDEDPCEFYRLLLPSDIGHRLLIAIDRSTVNRRALSTRSGEGGHTPIVARNRLSGKPLGNVTLRKS